MPLAIVGMACRVPGASNYEAFWSNVVAGTASMEEVHEEDRLREGIRLDPDVANQYVPMTAPLADYDKFDHAAFGIGAGEARTINLNHRVMMEVILEALEDAGCDPGRFDGDISVFAAGGGTSPLSVTQRLGNPQYGEIYRPLKASEALNWMAVLDNDFLATRAGYALDLRGACVTVQTACSSSLVSVHLACQSVLTGDSDIAIAGGVNVELPHRAGYYYQQGSIWSDDGYCRPFDRSANGTITASGAGAVVIKRLDRALSDGDPIHALIRGSAINNDGNEKVGFTAPSADRQSHVIRKALASAGMDPRDIGYLETHGTATAVGDVVEWAGIERALGQEGSPCGLGATKANVGHLGAAAGVVGLIKAALVLAHRQVPPVANFTELNPHISAAGPRLFVPDTCRPWETTHGSRCAGVSSMGIGGTNAHVVLEQAPEQDRADVRPLTGVHILPVSAASERSLESGVRRIIEFSVDSPELGADLAYTLREGRRQLPQREAVVVSSDETGQISTWRTGRVSAKPNPLGVLVLPGQGGELGDLSAAVSGIPGFSDLLSEAISSLAAADQESVRDLLTGTPESSDARLRELAVLVRSVTVARSLLRDGATFHALCGFSLGEVAAAVVAGVVDLGSAAHAISERARLLQGTPAGGMIRVRLSESDVADYLNESVSLAIVPGSRDCMLSGETAALKEVAARLRAQRIASVPVQVPHPFHSSVLRSAVEEYTAVWAQLDLSPPNIAVMSPTITGYLDEQTVRDPSFWASHLVRTVRFGDALNALRDEGVSSATVLDSTRGITGFVSEAFAEATVPMTMGDERGYDSLTRARILATAWCHGQGGVDLSGAGPARMVHAPTYAFDRGPEEERPPVSMNTASTAAVSSAPSPEAARASCGSEAPQARDLNVVDEAVRKMVATIAGVPAETLDPHLSFVDLGYDSFLLVQLVDAVSTEFRTSIQVKQLFFDLDTAHALASHIKDLANDGRATLRSPSGEPSAAPSVAPALSPPLAASTAAVSSAPSPEAPAQPSPETPTNTGAPVPAATPTEQAWADRTPISRRVTEEDRYALADQRNLVTIRKGRSEASYPIVGARGDGARFTDVDGREYLDLCMGFGVMLLGHASTPLTTALASFTPSDLLIGPQSSTAGDVARGIASLTGVDRVAFTSSGTEAVMAAVRAARAKTGRDLVALFSGSYHGTFDGVLAAPSVTGRPGQATPLGRGTPTGMVDDLIVLPYDESALSVLEGYGDELAAVLVEPVQSRRPGYQPVELLRALRGLTSRHGAALIFDEIITGFRCHPAGAASLFGIHPDLVTYGKVIGGGLPIGVVAGDAEFMAPIDGGRWREGDAGFPQRPSMMFAGTFSKHPLAMAAAQEMIRYLKKESPHLQNRLGSWTADLARRINEDAASRGYPIEVEYFSSLFRINVGGSTLAEDLFFLELLARGIYVWEGRTCFLSAAHTQADCDQIVDVVAQAADAIAAQGLWEPQNAQATGAPSAAPPPAPQDSAPFEADEVPLTDGQQLMWLAGELGGDVARAYDLAVSVRIEGKLDHDRLRRALAVVARRHEALRLTFDDDGEAQRCSDDATPALTVVNAPNASVDDVAKILQDLSARPPVDDMTSSLYRVHLVETSDVSYLQIAAPHTVADGWSFDVLWAELSACYLDSRGEGSLVAPASYLEYAQFKRTAEAEQFEANQAAWRPLLDPFWESADLVNEPGPWPVETRVDRLPQESLTGLRDLARQAECTMHSAAVSALAAACGALTESDQWLMMSHRCEQPRHTAQPLVGFGVDLLPVIVDLDPERSLVELTREVHGEVQWGVDRTSGLYRLLQDQRYRHLPTNLVAFNYERQRPATLFGYRAEPVSFPQGPTSWPAVVTFEELPDGIEIISEIAGVSALGSQSTRLGDALAEVLSAPAQVVARTLS